MLPDLAFEIGNGIGQISLPLGDPIRQFGFDALGVRHQRRHSCQFGSACGSSAIGGGVHFARTRQFIDDRVLVDLHGWRIGRERHALGAGQRGGGVAIGGGAGLVIGLVALCHGGQIDIDRGDAHQLGELIFGFLAQEADGIDAQRVVERIEDGLGLGVRRPSAFSTTMLPPFCVNFRSTTISTD